MPVIDLGRVIGPQGPQGETGAQGIRGEQGLPGPNQVTNSTATPLTGVLTGNGSVVGVESIDTAPTENSTGFAQSGGTDKAIKGRVPVYGLGKNLLDNWYFGNPVNQRGQSAYTGVVYGVDRWVGRNASTQVTVDSGCIYLNSTASGASGILDQVIENPDFLLNKRVTISAIVGGTLETHTVDMPSSYSPGYIIIGSRVYLGVGSDGSVIFRFVQAYTWQLQIVAAKLELGSEQTLCHNEGTAATPVWVLNEVPNYEHELYRCMTSTADSTDTFANKSLATQEQLAPIEWETTASARREVGSYFCWNGLLYRTTVAIDANNPITPGTNCEPSMLSDRIVHSKSYSGTTGNFGECAGAVPAGNTLIAVRIEKVNGVVTNNHAYSLYGSNGQTRDFFVFALTNGSRITNASIVATVYYI